MLGIEQKCYNVKHAIIRISTILYIVKHINNGGNIVHYFCRIYMKYRKGFEIMIEFVSI